MNAALTIVLVAAIAALALGVAIAAMVASERAKVVTANSAALRELERLNSTTILDSCLRQPIKYTFTNTCKSKSAFDRFDLERFFINCLVERERELLPQITARVQATALWDRYSADVETARLAHLGRSEAPNLPPAKFNKTEARLYAKRTIKQPIPLADVQVLATYTSPKGQNSYRKGITVNFQQLVAGMQQMASERERQSTTAFLRAQERSKMTQALRVQILRRDGSRCRMCGRSAVEVPLHVDHIVAVSNGGKTTESNLQTLCQDCNLGKSNRF